MKRIITIYELVELRHIEKDDEIGYVFNHKVDKVISKHYSQEDAIKAARKLAEENNEHIYIQLNTRSLIELDTKEETTIDYGTQDNLYNFVGCHGYVIRINYK